MPTLSRPVALWAHLLTLCVRELWFNLELGSMSPIFLAVPMSNDMFLCDNKDFIWSEIGKYVKLQTYG